MYYIYRQCNLERDIRRYAFSNLFVSQVVLYACGRRRQVVLESAKAVSCQYNDRHDASKLLPASDVKTKRHSMTSKTKP